MENDEMKSPYKLRVVRNGFEFEAEGDKEFVFEMADRFNAYSGSPQTSTDVSSRGSEIEEEISAPSSKGESVREFLSRLGLKRHVDLVVGFAYYLEHRMGKAEFTPADINNCYYEAKMEPSNTSQSIINATKRGLIMEAKAASSISKKGAKRKYTLTLTGEEFINKKLSP
ncbi:hypothetical protein [Thiolapillus sp.]